MKQTGYSVASMVSASLSLLVATQAHAASMQKVNQSDWWATTTGLPSYVNMYIYVPDQVAAKPPIVVIPHHCQGTASSSNSENTSLKSIADKMGFIIIFPEATGENCWDAGSIRSLKHGGGGDTGAIVQMVKYTLNKYSGDASRVYSVGGSSGGIMTEALLGVYPDVFMAGVSIMGVPCGCWASGYNDIVGTNTAGTAQWSGACAGGTVTHTAKEWGDLVRSYYPGYTGHRPRMQHWHGTADTTLNFKNLAEDVKEWTNLLGLSETPTGSDTPKSGTTRQYWKNSCGYTVYETFALAGVAHAVPTDGAAVAAYFGIDKAASADPETAACGGGTGGTGNTGGASSVGGASATGGRSAGGSSSTGGRAATGGSSGAALSTGGSVGNTGGNVAMATGGRLSTGGNVAMATGGRLSTGGNVAMATGGKLSTGGVDATGGNTTGPVSTGGAMSVGGSNGAGGNSITSSSVAGGAAAQAGASGTAINEGSGDNAGGCGCSVPGQAKNTSRTAAALLLASLGMLVRRRRARNAARNS